MKVRADEHVSPEIVSTVCKVCLTQGWQFDHVYDVADGGLEDEHWITRFAKDGGQAILSADTDFAKKPPQVAAVFATGIRVIQMPAKWANAQRYLQAAHILLWWPRIESQLHAMRQRECCRPEWNLNSSSGKFIKVDIDFAKAHKKLKKANKHAKPD